MGCYAALPGLGRGGRLRRAPAAARRCCSALELTSLHVQPPTTGDDPQQIVAHALFSDAAAAVCSRPGRRPGLRVARRGRR